MLQQGVSLPGWYLTPPRAVGVLAATLRCPTCLGDIPPDYPLDADGICEDCFEEQVETSLDFERPCAPYILIPTETYYDFLLKAFDRKLTRHPTRFRYVIHPFTLAGMYTLRACFLSHGAVETWPWPKMTRGMKRGKTKEWAMVVDETHSFQETVARGAFTPPTANSFGTARILPDHACVAWVPPLTFTLTSLDTVGERGTLVVTAGVARARVRA